MRSIDIKFIPGDPCCVAHASKLIIGTIKQANITVETIELADREIDYLIEVNGKDGVEVLERPENGVYPASTMPTE